MSYSLDEPVVMDSVELITADSMLRLVLGRRDDQVSNAKATKSRM